MTEFQEKAAEICIEMAQWVETQPVIDQDNMFELFEAKIAAALQEAWNEGHSVGILEDKVEGT